MQGLRTLGRRTLKLGVLGGGALGAATLGTMSINDDLDDISYSMKRIFYSAAKKDALPPRWQHAV